MTSDLHIVWHRQDLRLTDQPAVHAAANHKILPIYILDDAAAGDWALGGAQRWWLHWSLTRLAADYTALGAELMFARGDAVDILSSLAERHGAAALHATRHFEPYARRQEAALTAAAPCPVHLHASGYLREPGAVTTGSGTPFKVFTPYWRACQSLGAPGAPLPAPKQLSGTRNVSTERLDEWQLLPAKPDWAAGIAQMWTPGEAGAHAQLAHFGPERAQLYGTDRDLPEKPGTSQLSPHLHFGEVSARQVWHSLGNRMEIEAAEPFIRQLGWRDFSVSLITHAPDLPEAAWSPKFRNFPWRDDAAALKRWQRGQTGYPIVDAGMRQLWQTGWMHNRVRMIVASFLCKHLLLHWRHGEDWFWDTLVDADLANNAAGWQWVAGSGADASPYFRIFNPIAQAQKFDPQGQYIRRFVPELADLPTKFIHAPWTAPQNTLTSCEVVLGKTYPHPMVDHSAARSRALGAYEQIKAA
ncbi:MAG: deoxyribodipyrimidine photo-lyase [Pseudomonadota bacterium]